MVREHLRTDRLAVLEIITPHRRHGLHRLLQESEDLVERVVLLAFFGNRNEVELSENLESSFGRLERVNMVVSEKHRLSSFLYLVHQTCPFHYVLLIRLQIVEELFINHEPQHKKCM